MGEMRTIKVEEFHAELRAQGVTGREHVALKCPAYGTVQSMALLIQEGCPPERVDQFAGFSCVGRFNGAGPATREGQPRNPDKPGCDWSLGGLFTIHTLEVDQDGTLHPIFEPASADEAQALERRISK